jgi:hypothetical protein
MDFFLLSLVYNLVRFKTVALLSMFAFCTIPWHIHACASFAACRVRVTASVLCHYLMFPRAASIVGVLF